MGERQPRRVRSASRLSVPFAILLWSSGAWWNSDVEAQRAAHAPLPKATSGAQSLTAAGGHTCAVLADGTVRCWGLNVDGQLGQGERVGSPAAVQGVGTATGIAAGREHTCAVLDDGRVMCWGSNRDGQLGRLAIERGKILPAPAAVAEISGASQVAAGRDHTCALLREGGVRCWGGNSAGQLGDGSTSDSAAPIRVQGVSNAVGVAAGSLHTCAIVRDGTVRCWGANDAGQLGNPRLTPSAVPVPVEAISSATAIAAGHAHTCALLSDRTVHCWGSNEVGQVGVLGAGVVPTPVAATGLSEAVALGAGGTQGCAILADGTQRCWGTDGPPRAAQVIFAMRTPTPLPTPGVAGAAAVAPGLAHNCMLLRAGTVLCRGNNSEGQLGDGTFRTSRPPVPVAALAGVRAIASGDAHSCAIVADGGVRCWGSNTTGQLGRAVKESSPRPVAVAGLSNVTAADSGDAHTCVLLVDGTVRCWGRNTDGQLGRGWAHQGSTRTEPLIELPKARAIAAGSEFTCALLEGGTVRCWGKNSRGQLGDGTTRSSAVPIAVRGITGATAIAAGVSQACAVVSDGAVMCWGRGGPEDRPPEGSTGETAVLPTAGPVAVPGLQAATAAAIGQNFGCALRRHLTLVCWGANNSGQLGTPEVDSAAWPVMVTGVAYPVAVTAGLLHACAIRRDGKVRCWGRNDLGQLGPAATRESSQVPVTVEGIEQAVVISAGAAHTCAAIADGTVKCWGSNETAQLARDPTLKFSHRPVTVEALR